MAKELLTVIADDITGAAEIAGIGFRYGLRTVLSTEADDAVPDCDIWVIATDTRSMNEAEAADFSRQLARKLRSIGVRRLFKKTDSALRGHVVAELLALLAESDYRRALFLPCNPSKGRIIRQGTYYINEQPLHTTSFAFDPEFPADSSVVEERLALTGKGQPILVVDAESEKQMAEQVRSLYAPDLLLAGAADLFTTFLQQSYQLPTPLPCGHSPLNSSGRALIVCGSTQSGSLTTTPYVQRHAIPACQMPIEVFEGTTPASHWIEELIPLYNKTHAAILSIGYPSKGGKEFALRLRNTMAETVAALTASAYPDELVIEGGATAFAILQALSWTRFRLTDEVAPGVVRMQCEDVPQVHVTLKPGSYPWGELFK